MMFLLAPGTSVASGLSGFEFALPLPTLSPVTVAMAAEMAELMKHLDVFGSKCDFGFRAKTFLAMD